MEVRTYVMEEGAIECHSVRAIQTFAGNIYVHH